MNFEDTNKEYQANEAGAIVGEIFTGGITVADAIERLRTRLLDLSTRNRLLSYRHPKRRSVQICNEPNINLIFHRLFIDGKNVLMKYLQEPDPKAYEGKRPDAKLYASKIGISTSFEFIPNNEDSGGKRLSGMQTLLYPDELERQLRKIASEANSAIQETGSNMLYLMFGFLEYYDSEDSDRALLAPLISVPVTLMRGNIDTETRTYQYNIAHSGEDLAENLTLREKLRRDFMLVLPELLDEEEPESYFLRIEQSIKNKRRWKIRRQITLGMLSFGKLAIWADLDPGKNKNLLSHPLINKLFSGSRSEGEVEFYAEDYKIDERSDAAHELIYDADSSQHSAIIDVAAGKNIVINGPPGTGKSQTITNIIAFSLSKGMKVLFVAEKLAALEVVRRRLNHAGLGHFCLELHSNKTQKKKLLEDIRERIEQSFPVPSQFEAKLSILERKKRELTRYVELIGSKIGNALCLTVEQVFWAAERRRQELGPLSPLVNGIAVPAAETWTFDDLELRHAKLDGLSELYDAIGRFDNCHPWWGFRPKALAPTDDEAISRIIHKAHVRARLAQDAVLRAVEYFALESQPLVVTATAIAKSLSTLPDFPEGAVASLLIRIFDPGTDPVGKRSSKLISEFICDAEKAKSLYIDASNSLIETHNLSQEKINSIQEILKNNSFKTKLLSTPINNSYNKIKNLACAIDYFEKLQNKYFINYISACKSNIHDLGDYYDVINNLNLNDIKLSTALSKSKCVMDSLAAISSALDRVRSIVESCGITFDSSPEGLRQLSDPKGIPTVSQIDQQSIVEARRLASLPLSDQPISVIEQLAISLEEELHSCSEALLRCRSVSEKIGLNFEFTDNDLAEIVAVAKIASIAPKDLLDYRMASFGLPKAKELIERVRSFLTKDFDSKNTFESIFYLDALPSLLELKSAVASLRRSNGFLTFFDGELRKARRLHAGLSKEKRKISPKQQADELSSLATWVENREQFISCKEFQEHFGDLFRGIDTDVEKLSRINNWYVAAYDIFFDFQGLFNKIDLNTIPVDRIFELAAKSELVRDDANRLNSLGTAIYDILGANLAGFREARANNWESGLKCLSQAVKMLNTMSEFFRERVDSDLSPREALRLMEARVAFDAASDDFIVLLNGKSAIQESAGDELSYLVELAKGKWADVIPNLTKATTNVLESINRALVFASPDSTFEDAMKFAKGKSQIEALWSEIAPLPSWDKFNNWQEMVEAARSIACDAVYIFNILEPNAKPDASVLNILDAYSKEAEAKTIVEGFARRKKLRALLGDFYQGLETDLARLLLTLNWGKAIAEVEVCNILCLRLLSSDAKESLHVGRTLFSEIDGHCRDTKITLEELQIYGSFSWDEWHNIRFSNSFSIHPSEILNRIELAEASLGSVLHWSKYLTLRQQVKQEGLSDFLHLLESAQMPSSSLSAAFELATYQHIGRSIFMKFPEFSGFNGRIHEKIRGDFQSLDSEIISLTGGYFASEIDKRKRVPVGYRGTSVGEYTNMHLLHREISKRRRHIPIRQLINRAGDALLELKPCFMMGPLSVAQYLKQDSLKFDIIVMDEASQLKPEDSLGAIARGSQLVVVGDPKQLPPTNFFDRILESGDEEESDESCAVTSGMESILDICQHLFAPIRSLRWHYRSRHESLIEFSNFHFYKNLIIFPSPYAKNKYLGVKYRFIKNGIYKDRQNFIEAQIIVDAILEHMIHRKNESLGVVTLNLTQKELIEDLLDKKLKLFPESADYTNYWEDDGWPFFIKNLENVQGDERDVIFISSTFGKAPGTNKVRQNFGPISRPDGWRRLNVLFTRAKNRIEFFTSMTAGDIIVDEKTPQGTKALRDYLDYAKNGLLVNTNAADREPDSEFEISVANVVTSLGYEIKPQLGVAGFFIDMAVRNPDRPGEYLAGIECDGATYHSGFSARDRDRIRQEILESLGWEGRIYRIWSTDWFYNPKKEVERLRIFLDERRRVSAADDMGNLGEENENLINLGETSQEEAADIAKFTENTPTITGHEDIFIEVGDRVTYCFVDDPSKHRTFHIVDSASNPRMGIINEETPAAQALLGLSTGEVGELTPIGQKSRQIRVLKIQRQE